MTLGCNYPVIGSFLKFSIGSLFYIKRSILPCIRPPSYNPQTPNGSRHVEECTTQSVSLSSISKISLSNVAPSCRRDPLPRRPDRNVNAKIQTILFPATPRSYFTEKIRHNLSSSPSDALALKPDCDCKGNTKIPPNPNIHT